jgi:hypothetical protein
MKIMASMAAIVEMASKAASWQRENNEKPSIMAKMKYQ